MVKLEIPAYDTTTLSIDLPNPELFDSHNYSKNLSVHVSRGSVIRTTVFEDDVTKRVIVSEMEFKLTLDKMKELKEFLEEAKGEYIKYTDYEGYTWVCLVNQDTLDFSSNKTARGECLYRGEIYDFSFTIKKWKDGFGTPANPIENELDA